MFDFRFDLWFKQFMGLVLIVVTHAEGSFHRHKTKDFVFNGVLTASACVDDLPATAVCVCVSGCVRARARANDNGTLLGCVYLNP